MVDFREKAGSISPCVVDLQASGPSDVSKSRWLDKPKRKGAGTAFHCAYCASCQRQLKSKLVCHEREGQLKVQAVCEQASVAWSSSSAPSATAGLSFLPLPRFFFVDLILACHFAGHENYDKWTKDGYQTQHSTTQARQLMLQSA